MRRWIHLHGNSSFPSLSQQDDFATASTIPFCSRFFRCWMIKADTLAPPKQVHMIQTYGKNTPKTNGVTGDSKGLNVSSRCKWPAKCRSQTRDRVRWLVRSARSTRSTGSQAWSAPIAWVFLENEWRERGRSRSARFWDEFLAENGDVREAGLENQPGRGQFQWLWRRNGGRYVTELFGKLEAQAAQGSMDEVSFLFHKTKMAWIKADSSRQNIFL